MSRDLSPQQRKVYEYILDFVRRKGYPPSVREIGEALGLTSSSTVHGHLTRLAEKGYIYRDPTKPRAIELLVDPITDDLRAPTAFVPVVGQVTAGAPILAEDNVEEYFPLPEQLVRDQAVFMLRVRGDSMIEAGILDGDHVIVRQQQVADSGDIVVARIDDEATVKRFFREKGYIRLQPENSQMEPIIVEHCDIVGKVIGVFRHVH